MDWSNRARINFPRHAPGQFDFIANLPSGSMEAFRRKSKEVGLVGSAK